MTDVIFSSETIAAFLTAGIAAILIPIIAILIFKLKNRDVKLRYIFIGAATFLVFALMLEQIPHVVLLPTVMKSGAAVYVLYGTLCAGIFEETGRFVAFKLFCKKENDPRASIMCGLGHGGFEAMILLGMTMISYAITAVTINTLGTDVVFGSLPAEQLATAEAQLEQLVQYNMSGALLGIAERILAMTLHTSLSVVVFAAIKMRGKLWLYPAAVLLHALFDVPAALYQAGVIKNLGVVELLLLAENIVIVIFAVKVYKAMKAELAERAAEAPTVDAEPIESVETK